jgi:hypothetical protein
VGVCPRANKRKNKQRKKSLLVFSWFHFMNCSPSGEETTEQGQSAPERASGICEHDLCKGEAFM